LDGIQNLQESLPMTVRLKRVEDQVIVLTGASSGIGLATAHAAAARGARLVLVSRNDAALQQAARECNDMGGRAIPVVADVARREDLEHVARVAVETFGGFDTWINNAGLSVYGTLERIPLEDHRRLIDVNYWGVVHGSLIAARHLRARGGAIINTGSVVSDRAVPLQGPYSASKFAVKAFTDTLRMELEHDGAPVSVTLIKPSAIDTPFFEHARTYLDTPGVWNPPPAYDPSLVAKAMLHACENPKRSITIGAGGAVIGLMGRIAPRLTDFAMEQVAFAVQKSHEPGRRSRRDNLYAPREDGAERSSLPGSSRKTSLYLESQLHPVATMALLGGLGVAFGLMVRPRRSAPPTKPSRRDGMMARPRGEPYDGGRIRDGQRPPRRVRRETRDQPHA
jgi:short-subunit dehydrogenase